jgi:hypothetical protein
MKIRNGFVTNSSSSSYIIGVKGELTTEKVLKAFGVENESPIIDIIRPIAEYVAESDEINDIDEWLDECWGYEDRNDYDDYQKLKDLQKEEFKIFHCNVSSDEWGAGCILHEHVINIKTNEMVIFRDG